MILRLVPLVAGFVPLIAVFTSYGIAIYTAGLPSCNPFLDGCTSVSATGRHPPASYLFKGAMLPQSILLAVYWLLNVAWLRALAASAGYRDKRGTAVGVLGVGGSLFLILYVTFLGTEGDFYEFMRRYGVYMYFALNVFAQVILAGRVLPLARRLANRWLLRLTVLHLVLGWVPFALGALNLALKAMLGDASRPWENRIEWIFAMQMQIYFLVTFFSWQVTRFDASFRVTASKATQSEFSTSSDPVADRNG